MKHVDDTDALVYADGALPRKVKLLMAMAFDAADGAPGGSGLAEQAMKAGATKPEIAEALRVAFTCRASAASTPRPSGSRTCWNKVLNGDMYLGYVSPSSGLTSVAAGLNLRP